MRNNQRYILTYWDLFTIQNGVLCGAEAEVAVLDNGVEIDRMRFTGKCQCKEGYRRAYTGKPELTAELAFGPGRIHFVATDGGAYQEVLSEAVDGKTTSVYECTRRIDLPKAASGWLLRITCLTANQNNNKIADTMQIAGFTEVIDAKLRYPNTALL